MSAYYAPDDIVRRITNAGRSLTRADYVFMKEEAEKPYSAILNEVSSILQQLLTILEVKGDVYFAVVASIAPYQVVHLGDGTFVILVDRRAFYSLVTLCFRVQTLSPLADHFGFDNVETDKDYKGMFLIDIVKDFSFYPRSLVPFMHATRSALIYQAALTYVIAHEIAHISHGHLEFKASQEFAQFTSSDDDLNLTLQTLEMDADSSATTSVVDVFERYLASQHSLERMSKDTTIAQMNQSVREQYVVAMFIALLHQDALSPNSRSGKYPIGYARFLTTSAVARIVLADMDDRSAAIPDAMRPLLTSIFSKLNQGAELGHPMAANITIYSGDDIREEYDPKGVAIGRQHLEPLYGRWSRIRPYLQKFQRGGRLAPARAHPF